MITTVIGTGLIGGSMAIALRDLRIASKVIGVDASESNLKRAAELNIVDEVSQLKPAIERSQLVIVAIPVHAAERLLPEIMDAVTTQVVMDVSSTKETIINSIKHHPRRSRFVATHPMWGTENSGPEAAVRGAFTGKVTVISDKEHSDADAVKVVENIYTKLGMRILYMDAISHDIHAAYVSHISHITSFALANTVLEKEREEDTIFAMASAGFESTVRLAKSNPAMWVQIFMQNRENILDVLNEHIAQLRKFKSCLEKENEEYLEELITNANKIKKILK
ncbi:MAG: prephenate dehydrogenase [Chitinophagaceae bacterium]|nr:prephenate dehydrogenase [Chitinophagaceae bacterium]